eukprot:gnl/MRDRNA2_/MRDRNA2_248495_c0_seq1.p1 gnl/MRDRNA2_/MRDRNA2_248495_c0~~gnl/MRDRNA2_/MRDRNA2_248495_c0_seq1.p1  ORF type:complete len:102 (-),score=11.85 gnl/MRDRNA2_/MRDRNA2_248495_c0_seq1:465-770(-)
MCIHPQAWLWTMLSSHSMHTTSCCWSLQCSRQYQDHGMLWLSTLSSPAALSQHPSALMSLVPEFGGSNASVYMVLPETVNEELGLFYLPQQALFDSRSEAH